MAKLRGGKELDMFKGEKEAQEKERTSEFMEASNLWAHKAPGVQGWVSMRHWCSRISFTFEKCWPTAVGQQGMRECVGRQGNHGGRGASTAGIQGRQWWLRLMAVMDTQKGGSLSYSP